MTSRRLITAAGITGAVGAGLTLLLLDQIVAAIYAENGPQFLVNVIEGRDVHAVNFYQDLARQRLRAPLLVLALLGSITAVGAASNPKIRARAAGIMDGRLGLLLTGLIVIGAVTVLIVRHVEPPLPALVISEVLTSNANLVPDEDGDHPDWVELWNRSEQPVQLSGYRLIRDGVRVWKLPVMLLEPNGRVVIYASGKDVPDWPAEIGRWVDAGARDLEGEGLALQLGERDPVTGAPNWIDLTNRTEGSIDLAEVRLLASGEPLPLLEPFVRPEGSLRVLLSEDDLPPRRLHAPFPLPQSGVLLELQGPNEVDAIEVPPLARNVSFGRDRDDPRRWCRFVFPTPSELNDRECFDDERLGAPLLSRSTGTYGDSIEVTIEVTEGVGPVIYTLDGTYPDLEENSGSTHVYSEPIALDVPRPITGPLSRIDTTITDPGMEYSTLFRERPGVSSDIRPGVTIRARTVDSAETVATYLFDPENPAREGRLPFIALTLDPDHLFDHEQGIYIAGATFERWRTSDDFNPQQRWNAPANYRGRTRAWERPFESNLHDAVWLEYCSSRGCDEPVQVGIRIHGNASRTRPQHSLRLYARNDFQNPSFTSDFFADGAWGWRTLILRNGGNNSNTFGRNFHFNDAFFQSTMLSMAADTQAFAPVAVEINGEYWGIHNLRERYDATYVEVRHGIPAANVAMLGTGPSAPRPDEIQAHWAALLDDARELDPADPTSRARIESAMDIDSFFDFIIAHTYAGNTDWPGNNSRWWRSIEATDPIGEGPADGRWRWMIMDLDRVGNSVSRPDVTHPTLLSRLPPDSSVSHAQLLHGLMRFPDYRERFFSRYDEHLTTMFAPQRMERLLGELVDLVEEEMFEHQRRWLHHGATTVEETAPWLERVGEIRSFVRERPKHVREHLEHARVEWFTNDD